MSTIGASWGTARAVILILVGSRGCAVVVAWDVAIIVGCAAVLASLRHDRQMLVKAERTAVDVLLEGRVLKKQSQVGIRKIK